MHLAGRDYSPKRANALGPGSWSDLLARSRDRADSVLPGLTNELEHSLARILQKWPYELTERGQIHADLFPDNVFFLDNRLSGLIDFYFAATDILAYDLAICLNAWCFRSDYSYDRMCGQELLRGYTSVRRLAKAERSALPVLCQGAALRFLLTRLFDWLNTPDDAYVTRKDPLDYLYRLRFHMTCRNVEDYGV